MARACTLSASSRTNRMFSTVSMRSGRIRLRSSRSNSRLRPRWRKLLIIPFRVNRQVSLVNREMCSNTLSCAVDGPFCPLVSLRKLQLTHKAQVSRRRTDGCT